MDMGLFGEEDRFTRCIGRCTAEVKEVWGGGAGAACVTMENARGIDGDAERALPLPCPLDDDPAELDHRDEVPVTQRDARHVCEQQAGRVAFLEGLVGRVGCSHLDLSLGRSVCDLVKDGDDLALCRDLLK